MKAQYSAHTKGTIELGSTYEHVILDMNTYPKEQKKPDVIFVRQDSTLTAK